MADELGDVDADGAAGLAGLVLAVDAALGLVHSHLGGVAQSHFLKILVADVGVLGGDVYKRQMLLRIVPEKRKTSCSIWPK